MGSNGDRLVNRFDNKETGSLSGFGKVGVRMGRKETSVRTLFRVRSSFGFFLITRWRRKKIRYRVVLLYPYPDK